jgi:pSer/pThr/pTyr-binding forkhead associated (FHA) protein
MECGAQLGAFRPPPGDDPNAGPGAYRPDPYQQDPYRQDPYGHQPRQQDPYRQDPYAGPDAYGRQQTDPYAAHRADTPYLPSGAPPTGPARLILESGLGKIEYPLDAPVVTIGRSRSNDISLEDSRVSRHHARIVRDERGFLIEDLNSRNGTRVDDRAVRDSAALTDGAVVRIGDSVFRFSIAPPVAQPPHQGPGQFGGGYAPAADLGSPVPEVFVSPWSPVQCPDCQGLKTMRPIVYGSAAQTQGAQAAARRGEVTLGEGPARPNGPNAECRACGTRVRIVSAGG